MNHILTQNIRQIKVMAERSELQKQFFFASQDTNTHAHTLFSVTIWTPVAFGIPPSY